MAKDKKDKKDKKFKLKVDDKGIVFLSGVRMSYPKFFSLPRVKDSQTGEMTEGKAGCLLLLNKENDREMAMKKALMGHIEEVSSVKLEQLPPAHKLALRDGSDANKPDNDHWHLSANCAPGQLPTVVSNDGQNVITDPSKFSGYSGCYINCKVRFWVQDNVHGRRINCELISLQFAKDGEALGTALSHEDKVEGFEAVDPDDDDDYA